MYIHRHRFQMNLDVKTGTWDYKLVLTARYTSLTKETRGAFLSPWSGLQVIGHFGGEIRTWSVLCRTALWNCFGDTFWPSFLGNVIAKERRDSVPKTIHGAFWHNTRKWPIDFMTWPTVCRISRKIVSANPLDARLPRLSNWITVLAVLTVEFNSVAVQWRQL